MLRTFLEAIRLLKGFPFKNNPSLDFCRLEGEFEHFAVSTSIAPLISRQNRWGQLLPEIMQSKISPSAFCLPLLLALSLGCADKPTAPELTEEDVARIVAEELAKMDR